MGRFQGKYEPKPREATSVATRMGALPERNSENKTKILEIRSHSYGKCTKVFSTICNKYDNNVFEQELHVTFAASFHMYFLLLIFSPPFLQNIHLIMDLLGTLHSSFAIAQGLECGLWASTVFHEVHH